MYRKPVSPGVLQGVLSGPHAGGKKLVDAQKLPRAARQRLADVLSGRAEPTPFLHERPGGLASRFRATWGVLVAIFALAALTAVGFGDPEGAWAYQPRIVMGAYAGAATLLSLSLLSLYRRRALASGNALVPGRYLLPLDVVEVPKEDAAGDQILVVTPLGDARDARVRESGRRHELLLVFDDGAEIVFALRSERDGEHALRRLEHTQKLLEELTYGRELEKAVTNDAFFDVRVDASWESLAPSGPVSFALRKRRTFVHGSLATAGAVMLGACLGWAAFAGRSWASDRALFLRALRIGTNDSIEQYLVRGTSHRGDAVALRERLEAQRVELARRAAESRARSPGFEGPPRSEWELTPEEAAMRRGSSDACIASIHARSSTSHPEMVPLMTALILRAQRTGDTLVPVRVHTHLGRRPTSSVPDFDDGTRVARVVTAFERIFSETCPAGVLQFVLTPRRPATDRGSLGLDIAIEVTWPATVTWQLEVKSPVYAPTVVFDVALQGERPEELAKFRLTMPPPVTLPAGARERSLFVVAPRTTAEAPDAFAYRVLSARAFDQLYDELYSLFFRGDPRVPLRDEDGAP
jgi:hypothetical protein